MDENELRDDATDPSDSHKGIATGVGVVVALLAIFMIAGFLYGAAKSNPPGVTTCSTSCLIFIRQECPGTRYMGTCFGASVCDQPVHTCGVNPP